MPAKLGECFDANLTGVYYRALGGSLVESKSRPALRALQNLKLSTGWIPAWDANPRIAPVTPQPILRMTLWIHPRYKLTDPGDYFIFLYGDKSGRDLYYPAIFSWGRLYGSHDDKDKHNHPDKGWWAIKRSEFDLALKL